jgi:hypothetical protein
MFNMHQSNVGGIPWEQLMKLDFLRVVKLTRFLALLCQKMERIYDSCNVFNPPTHILL